MEEIVKYDSIIRKYLYYMTNAQIGRCKCKRGYKTESFKYLKEHPETDKDILAFVFEDGADYSKDFPYAIYTIPAGETFDEEKHRLI